jgi:von Willebrand factor type A domain
VLLLPPLITIVQLNLRTDFLQQRILKRARNGTSRAVFLLTDGYSNGGDPREAAKIVREKFGAEVFTFGVRNGNTQELLAMATSADHCYVLNSFQQFAALARRALHQGTQTKKVRSFLLIKVLRSESG